MHSFQWSFSTIETYDRCPFKFKLRTLDRQKEPPLPLPSGKTEHANDRGTRLHTAAEEYVDGHRSDLEEELNSFKPNLDQAKLLYSQDLVTQEEEWAVTRDWQPTQWLAKDVYGRLKLDLCVLPPGNIGLVVDLKSGKYQGNEVKHASQGKFYATVTLLRNPKLTGTYVEFWYFDHGVMSKVLYNRHIIAPTIAWFDKKVMAMAHDKHMRPKPSKFNCTYCGYSQGICPFAHKE